MASISNELPHLSDYKPSTEGIKMIDQKRPISELGADIKHNNNLRTIVDKVKEGFTAFRGVRGDDNCFYHCLTAGILSKCCTDGTEKQRIFNLIKQTQCDDRSKQVALNALNKLNQSNIESIFQDDSQALAFVYCWRQISLSYLNQPNFNLEFCSYDEDLLREERKRIGKMGNAPQQLGQKTAAYALGIRLHMNSSLKNKITKEDTLVDPANFPLEDYTGPEPTTVISTYNNNHFYYLCGPVSNTDTSEASSTPPSAAGNWTNDRNESAQESKTATGLKYEKRKKNEGIDQVSNEFTQIKQNADSRFRLERLHQLLESNQELWPNANALYQRICQEYRSTLTLVQGSGTGKAATTASQEQQGGDEIQNLKKELDRLGGSFDSLTSDAIAQNLEALHIQFNNLNFHQQQSEVGRRLQNYLISLDELAAQRMFASEADQNPSNGVASAATGSQNANKEFKTEDREPLSLKEQSQLDGINAQLISFKEDAPSIEQFNTLLTSFNGLNERLKSSGQGQELRKNLLEFRERLAQPRAGAAAKSGRDEKSCVVQ